MGDFDSARQYAMRAVEIWHSGDGHSVLEDLDAPAVNCLCYVALAQWHLGEVASSKATMTEAISLAEALLIGLRSKSSLVSRPG
jgi:hypothetical protein